MGSGGCTGSADRMKGSWTDMRLGIDAQAQFQKLRICAIIFPQNLWRIFFAAMPLQQNTSTAFCDIERKELAMETTSHEIWNVTALNKFIYKQTKELCEAHGFVSSPNKSKTLVRIKDHMIQRICPEILYSSTRIHVYVNPSTSFCDYLFAEKKVFPRKTNKPTDELINSYDEIGIDRNSDDIKWEYDSEVMKTAWDRVVVPQLEEEAFSLLDQIDFQEYTQFCEKRRGALFFVSQAATHDATWYMARGHDRLWQGKIHESIPLLEQALQGYETYFGYCKMYEAEGEEVDDAQERDEYNATKKLLEIIQNGGADLEAQVLAYMEELERTALNKTWGVALSSEGKTVRLKKKERL